MIDLVEQEPRFFKKYFSHLFQAMQKICGVKNIEDEGLKQMAIQVICCFAEREPKVFEDDTKLLRDYLEMILAYMIEICETPDEDWEVPEEGKRWRYLVFTNCVLSSQDIWKFSLKRQTILV